MKCLSLSQQTGQRLLRSMTSTVFVTIKSLNFHNLSASLCQREKPVRTHTRTHTHTRRETIFPFEHESEGCGKRLVVIPANPSVKARDER